MVFVFLLCGTEKNNSIIPRKMIEMSDGNLFVIVVFTFIILTVCVSFFLNFQYQKFADSKIKENDLKFSQKIDDFQTQLKQGAETTRRIREEIKKEFEDTLASQNSRLNGKINVLEGEVASLSQRL
jgi:low affinity Fe/Cu permease